MEVNNLNYIRNLLSLFVPSFLSPPVFSARAVCLREFHLGTALPVAQA